MISIVFRIGIILTFLTGCLQSSNEDTKQTERLNQCVELYFICLHAVYPESPTKESDCFRWMPSCVGTM